MKKMILWITLLLGISVTCMAEKEIQIGITQIIEHPSLDAARKGLEKALQKNLGKKVKIECGHLRTHMYSVVSVLCSC